jgi:hypothetical protein
MVLYERPAIIIMIKNVNKKRCFSFWEVPRKVPSISLSAAISRFYPFVVNFRGNYKCMNGRRLLSRSKHANKEVRPFLIGEVSFYASASGLTTTKFKCEASHLLGTYRTLRLVDRCSSRLWLYYDNAKHNTTTIDRYSSHLYTLVVCDYSYMVMPSISVGATEYDYN